MFFEDIHKNQMCAHLHIYKMPSCICYSFDKKSYDLPVYAEWSPNQLNVFVKWRINCVLGDDEPDSPNGCLGYMETPMWYNCGMSGSHNYLEGSPMLTVIETKRMATMF